MIGHAPRALGVHHNLVGGSPKAFFGNASALQNFNPEDMIKALATNGTVGTDGSAMIGYDLDKLVRVITLAPENHTPKLQRWFTYNAKALLRQYNVLVNRGRAKGSARAEGRLGVQDASTYERRSKAIKFVGRTAVTTFELQAAAEQAFGDLKSMEVANQLAQMLMDIDRDIWHGNTDYNSLIFEGILQQIDSGAEYRTDLATTATVGSRTAYTAGGSLTLAQVRAQTPKIIREGGTYTALYLSHEDKEILSSEQDSNSRWYKQDQNSRLVLGMRVDQIAKATGEPLDLIPDIWLSGIRGELFPEPNDPSDSTLFHADQPAQPASGTVANPALKGSNDGSLPVDEYFYGVAFKNEAGEGPIRIVSTGVTTTTNDGHVAVAVTMPSDISRIKSLVLYRSTTGGAYGNFRRVKEVQRTAAASAAQTIYDDGTVIPGSREAVLLNEYMADLGSLANPQAIDLAQIDLTHRTGIFGMVNTILHAPKHAHHYSNIGGSVADPA